jgi:hypothetical protein
MPHNKRGYDTEKIQKDLAIETQEQWWEQT